MIMVIFAERLPDHG